MRTTRTRTRTKRMTTIRRDDGEGDGGRGGGRQEGEGMEKAEDEDEERRRTSRKVPCSRSRVSSEKCSFCASSAVARSDRRAVSAWQGRRGKGASHLRWRRNMPARAAYLYEAPSRTDENSEDDGNGVHRHAVI